MKNILQGALFCVRCALSILSMDFPTEMNLLLQCINKCSEDKAECPLCRMYFKTDRNYPELRSAAN